MIDMPVRRQTGKQIKQSRQERRGMKENVGCRNRLDRNKWSSE